MPTELLLTNIGFIVSTIVCLSLGILVLVKRPKTGGAVNVVFFYTSLAEVVWQVSYMVGVNLNDPYLSRFAFMFNLSTLFLVILNTHLVLALAGRFAPRKRLFIVFYSIAGLLTLFYAIFPDTFLLPSRPLSYFANFFVPGSLYEIQDTYFFILFFYFLYEMYASYRASSYVIRQRLRYFIAGLVYAYFIALFPEFLVYGINIDPVLACLVGLNTIPLAYAILKYDLVNLNILAKKSFGYALSIASVTLFILLIGYANDYITVSVPAFPQWLLPLISSIIAVAVGVIAWRKIKEVDVLKYQFITVVTHKFRTPLTHINWIVENLKNEPGAPAERIQALNQIAGADLRLTELTNTLLGVSASEDSQIYYDFTAEKTSDIIEKVTAAASDRLHEKEINLQSHVPEGLPLVWIDKKKVMFVLQMILENAVTYSPPKATVIVGVEEKKKMIVVSVKDSGIGIGAEDLPRLFTKFFRSATAIKTYTEGLGIGLYLSREIMDRQGGNVWVESAGVGKGSTFYVSMPVQK